MTRLGKAKRLFKHATDIIAAGLVMFACASAAMPASGQSPTMIYEGFTEPMYDIMVAATEIGRLDEVTVEVGDIVEAGQIIARLEDSLQASSVKIGELQASMRGEADAARAEAILHHSRTLKIQELAKEGMARPDELVRAETDLRIADARQAAAEEQISLRKLELERYRLQLQRRIVRSPMSGVIAKVFHYAGEYITPSDPAVAQLLVVDQLYAVFNVPVEEVRALQAGTEVRVFLRSQSTTLIARVSSVAPSIDGESGTVQVRVALPNSDGELRVGDRCTLRLEQSQSPESATRSGNSSGGSKVR